VKCVRELCCAEVTVTNVCGVQVQGRKEIAEVTETNVWYTGKGEEKDCRGDRKGREICDVEVTMRDV
jgi:hypothetical protein